MTGKMLGRLPEDKSKPKLAFGDFIDTANLPPYPLVDTVPQLSYPMDHNDTVGCCVVAGVDHALRVIHTLLTGSYQQPDDATLLRWYQTQNPDFKSWDDGGTSADGGMVIADLLAWLVKQGIILGFAKVDHANEAQILAATYLGLAVLTGEDVRSAQMNSQLWDYTPTSPDEGGHCTATHAYESAQRLRVITWGSDAYEMTDKFLAHGVDEAYIIITQAHVDHPGFRDSFDLAGFAAAYKQITGRDFPVPVTPAPTPAPTPGPSNTVTVTLTVADAADIEAWAVAPHAWAKATRAAKAWKRGQHQ